MLVSVGWRWVAAVHGDRLCLYWRNDKSEPVERGHTFKHSVTLFSDVVFIFHF